MQMLIHKDDGTPLLVFGLSFNNVRELKKDNPILLDLSKLGLEGLMVITAKNEKGEAAVPEMESGTVLALSHADLDKMKGGSMTKVEFDVGEIVLFSAKDEHTMEQMFKDFEFNSIQGSTCSKCGTGRRDDGSCDCKETMQ